MWFIIYYYFLILFFNRLLNITWNNQLHPCTNWNNMLSSLHHRLPIPMQLEVLHVGCILNLKWGIHKVLYIHLKCWWFEAVQWGCHDCLKLEKIMKFWVLLANLFDHLSISRAFFKLALLDKLLHTMVIRPFSEKVQNTYMTWFCPFDKLILVKEWPSNQNW